MGYSFSKAVNTIKLKIFRRTFKEKVPEEEASILPTGPAVAFDEHEDPALGGTPFL